MKNKKSSNKTNNKKKLNNKKKSNTKNKTNNKEKSINSITSKNALEYIEKEKDKIYTYKFMEKKCKLWQEKKFMSNYPLQEKFLDDLFIKNEKYRSNDRFDSVYIKVKILDSFYSTNLKEGLNKMVDNIIKSQFDKKINEEKALDLVDKLKKVNSTLSKSKNCISFASKYCSRYRKSKFPIYDNLVKSMLVLINKVTNDNGDNKVKKNTKEKRNSNKKISDYKEYCKNVDSFIEKFNENEANEGHEIDYKKMDRYIWTWAKEILYKINKKRKK